MIDISKYGDRLIVGVSGGKDSTATCLHLMEQGLSKSDFDRVFMDTGWEHPITYKHLDELEKTIGPIIRLRHNVKVKDEHKGLIDAIEADLGFESDFVRLIVRWHDFPNYFKKWCTRELKLAPLKKWLDTLDFDPINVIGIRREESQKRSKYQKIEWNRHLDAYSYRPILEWKLQDVIDIHGRFGLRPNPLYLKSSDRVGCYPCIYARKSEIRDLDQSRIDVIKILEKHVNEYRRSKGIDLKTGFFEKSPIEQIYEWSKTSLGGKQFQLFDLSRPKC